MKSISSESSGRVTRHSEIISGSPTIHSEVHEALPRKPFLGGCRSALVAPQRWLRRRPGCERLRFRKRTVRALKPAVAHEAGKRLSNPLRDSLSVDFVRVIMRERHLVIGITDGVVPNSDCRSELFLWRFRAVMSSGGKRSVDCPSIRLPPAGQTPVAMFRQGSPREIRISKSMSRMRAPFTTFA